MHQLFWMSWAPARSSSTHPVALILHQADITNAKHSSCSPELRFPVPAELNNPSLAGNQIPSPHTHTHPHPPRLCLCDCMVENSFFPGSVCCWARQLSRLTTQSHKQKQALSVAAVSCGSSSALHYIRVCWNHSLSFLTFLSIFNWSHFPQPLRHAGSCREHLETTEHSIRPVFLANFYRSPAASTQGAVDMLSSAAPEHTAQDSRNRAFFPSPVFQVPCPRQLLLNTVTECDWITLSNWVLLSVATCLSKGLIQALSWPPAAAHINQMKSRRAPLVPKSQRRKVRVLIQRCWRLAWRGDTWTCGKEGSEGLFSFVKQLLEQPQSQQGGNPRFEFISSSKQLVLHTTHANSDPWILPSHGGTALKRPALEGQRAATL